MMTPQLPSTPDVTLNAVGLACPLPLLKAKQSLHAMASGQVLLIVASDSGSERDIPAWCRLAGHMLLASNQEAGTYRFLVQKK